MRNKSLFIISALIICMCLFLMTACSAEPKPYTSIHGQIITKLDTRNNKVRINGIVPSSLVLMKDYECRVEENSMYIKIMLTSYKDGEFKEIDFEEELPDSIEKIFIEDDKNSIMIWEKSEGYRELDIQSKWDEELEKLGAK